MNERSGSSFITVKRNVLWFFSSAICADHSGGRQAVVLQACEVIHFTACYFFFQNCIVVRHHSMAPDVCICHHTSLGVLLQVAWPGC